MKKLIEKLSDPSKAAEVLANIQTLLEEANNAFTCLSADDQNVLMDYHNAEGCIGLTLRNGLTASNELLEALRPEFVSRQEISIPEL